MSVEVTSGLAYGYFLTADEVEAVLDSCSDFEREILHDSWLIPLNEYAPQSNALFAVKLRTADPGFAKPVQKDLIESGLAVQMMSDFRVFCGGVVTGNPEPQFYVYSQYR